MDNIDSFQQDLTRLINKYSLEGDSDTADFIIADYLVNCLVNLNSLIENKNCFDGVGEVSNE